MQARLRKPDVCPLTLTGPGSVGKARLALAVAAGLLRDFPDGVFFVDLVPVRDPDLIVTTIARALDMRESGAEPLAERLHRYLQGKRLLLVLDNFEHLLPAAVHVASLLADCPQLKVLATSRAALNLRGEQQVAVPPLALPHPQPAFRAGGPMTAGMLKIKDKDKLLGIEK